MENDRLGKPWDIIYQKEGMVQVEPIGAIQWLVDRVGRNNDFPYNFRILDAGCGTGRNICLSFVPFRTVRL